MKFKKGLIVIFLFCIFFVQAPSVFAGDKSGKWLNYGNGVLNLNNFGIIKMAGSIAEIDEDFISKNINQNLVLSSAIEFTIPTSFTLQLFNGKIGSIEHAREVKKNMLNTYNSIIKFLDSSETYMILK